MEDLLKLWSAWRSFSLVNKIVVAIPLVLIGLPLAVAVLLFTVMTGSISILLVAFIASYYAIVAAISLINGCIVILGWRIVEPGILNSPFGNLDSPLKVAVLFAASLSALCIALVIGRLIFDVQKRTGRRHGSPTAVSPSAA